MLQDKNETIRFDDGSGSYAVVEVLGTKARQGRFDSMQCCCNV